MKSIFAGFVCRVLAISMIVLPCQAQAGLVGTEQVQGSAQRLDRDALAAQLQSFGLTPQAARERVAALSDAELADLTGRIDALPAGATGPLPAIVFLILFYMFIIKPTTAESKEPKASPKTSPPSKPAPAPEKK